MTTRKVMVRNIYKPWSCKEGIVQTTESVHDDKTTKKPSLGLFDTRRDALKELRDAALNPSSNYNSRIPRSLLAALCDVSTSTIQRLESESIISPTKEKYKNLDLVTYSIEDVQAVFKYKGISLKQKKDAEVISIFSQKGGVGKSAYTQQLGSMFSLFGKTLIVDLDAQSDATVLYGQNPQYGDLVEEEEESLTIYDLMDWKTIDSDNEDETPELRSFDEVVKSVSPSLDIIPADLNLGEINYSLNRENLVPRELNGRPMPGVLFMIKEVLDKVKSRYDYILIDCPPNIETCNVSALYASDRIIIPLELEAKSLLTMRRNVAFLERLMDLEPTFEWDKVLVVRNKFKREKIKTKAAIALEDHYGDHEFITLSNVVMPHSVIIDKCADWKAPAFTATTRFGSKELSAIPSAKEFTNYFWGLAHEILDLEVDRLVFDKHTGGELL